MDGNLTALIDGHHKAMAAALEHREVKTLVISPCYHIYHTTESGEKKLYLAANDVTFLSDECEIKSCNYVREVLGPEQMDSVLSMMPTDIDNYKFDINTKELASYYPIVEEYASIDAFGEISESIIDAFISGERVFDKDICTFIEALATFPLTSTLPASHASFATVRLFIILATFKNLSNLIITSKKKGLSKDNP